LDDDDEAHSKTIPRGDIQALFAHLSIVTSPPPHQPTETAFLSALARPPQLQFRLGSALSTIAARTNCQPERTTILFFATAIIFLPKNEAPPLNV
jgi:hypothetical protein